MVWVSFLCKESKYWFMVCKKTVGGLDPSIENSYSVVVHIIAVHSLIRVEILSSACVNCLDLAKMRFILFAPL